MMTVHYSTGQFETFLLYCERKCTTLNKSTKAGFKWTRSCFECDQCGFLYWGFWNVTLVKKSSKVIKKIFKIQRKDKYWNIFWNAQNVYYVYCQGHADLETGIMENIHLECVVCLFLWKRLLNELHKMTCTLGNADYRQADRLIFSLEKHATICNIVQEI